jgi:hypothetical protein
MPSAPQAIIAPIDPPAASKPKTDRKEYLRLKAAERRAATKLGLTVQDYRAKIAQDLVWGKAPPVPRARKAGKE